MKKPAEPVTNRGKIDEIYNLITGFIQGHKYISPELERVIRTAESLAVNIDKKVPDKREKTK
jgi:hypothetical protein